MTYNAGSGRSDDELREIAVQHLLHDTEHWPFIVTEADAREAVDRMHADEQRFGPEITRERCQQTWAMYPPPSGPVVIDLTVPVDVPA